MLAALRSLVQDVLLIVLLGSFLHIILPQGSMRRYVQLTLALVLVLALLRPMMALTQTKFDLPDLLGQAQLQTTWAELQYRGQLLQEHSQGSLLANYREMLQVQVQQLLGELGEWELESCCIQLVEDPDADDFGRITAMQLVVQRASEHVQPVAGVPAVRVGNSDSAGRDAQPETAAEASAAAAAVQQRLASYFSLVPTQIKVIVK